MKTTEMYFAIAVDRSYMYYRYAAWLLGIHIHIYRGDIITSVYKIYTHR